MVRIQQMSAIFIRQLKMPKKKKKKYLNQPVNKSIWNFGKRGELHRWSDEILGYMTRHSKYDISTLKKETHGLYYKSFSELKVINITHL